MGKLRVVQGYEGFPKLGVASVGVPIIRTIQHIGFILGGI